MWVEFSVLMPLNTRNSLFCPPFSEILCNAPDFFFSFACLLLLFLSMSCLYFYFLHLLLLFVMNSSFFVWFAFLFTDSSFFFFFFFFLLLLCLSSFSSSFWWLCGAIFCPEVVFGCLLSDGYQTSLWPSVPQPLERPKPTLKLSPALACLVSQWSILHKKPCR